MVVLAEIDSIVTNVSRIIDRTIFGFTLGKSRIKLAR